MATPYYTPSIGGPPISSAAMGREAQQDWMRNQALLGAMGPAEAYAAGRPQNQSYVSGGVEYPMSGSGGGTALAGASGNPFLDAWNQAYGTARNANEDRYAAIRGGGSSGGTAANGATIGPDGRVYQNGVRMPRAWSNPEIANAGSTTSAQTDDEKAAMGGYLGRYQRNLGRLEQLGAQERADITDRYDKQAAAGQQDLTNRGLANSTILGTMKLGVQREKSDALSRVHDRQQRELIDADARLSGDQLAFMERRTDAYPEQEFLAQLLQAAGRAGVGAGNVASNMMNPQTGAAQIYQFPGNMGGVGGMAAGAMPFAMPFLMPRGGAPAGGGGFMSGPPVPGAPSGGGMYGGSASSTAYLPPGGSYDPGINSPVLSGGSGYPSPTYGMGMDPTMDADIMAMLGYDPYWTLPYGSPEHTAYVNAMQPTGAAAVGATSAGGSYPGDFYGPPVASGWRAPAAGSPMFTPEGYPINY